jgi:AraC family transcriptional regulator
LLRPLLEWAAKNGVITPDTKVLGLSWDDPTQVPAERLRYDAAVAIERRVDTPEGIRIAALPATTWARTIPKGS